MKLNAREIAELIQATLVGNPETFVSGFSSFDEACETDITFAHDSKFLARINTTQARIIIVPDEFHIASDLLHSKTFLQSKNPKLSFFSLVSTMMPAKKPASGIHPGAVIGEGVCTGKDCIIEAGVVLGDDVVIGDSVHLMPNVYIGAKSTLGSHTIVKPNVTIMERSLIGSHVLIHPGSVIGSDGFGFTQDSGGHEKIVHTGYVVIEDSVEIGACNTIDRGTLGKTIIRKGVKTDNLVHIAHNVDIGENTLLVAQVGIAGSTRLGRNVIVAGKAGISGHLTIGDNAIVGPYAGVHSDVPAQQIVSGIPQMPHARWRKVVSIMSRLPEMRKKLFSHEKRLDRLEKKH